MDIVLLTLTMIFAPIFCVSCIVGWVGLIYMVCKNILLPAFEIICDDLKESWRIKC